MFSVEWVFMLAFSSMFPFTNKLPRGMFTSSMLTSVVSESILLTRLTHITDPNNDPDLTHMWTVLRALLSGCGSICSYSNQRFLEVDLLDARLVTYITSNNTDAEGDDRAADPVPTGPSYHMHTAKHIP